MTGLPAWIEDWLTVVVPVAEVLAILGVAWVMVRALAWLLVQQRLAEQAGDAAQVQALQLRLQVLQEDGR